MSVSLPVSLKFDVPVARAPDYGKYRKHSLGPQGYCLCHCHMSLSLRICRLSLVLVTVTLPITASVSVSASVTVTATATATATVLVKVLADVVFQNLKKYECKTLLTCTVICFASKCKKTNYACLSRWQLV